MKLKNLMVAAAFPLAAVIACGGTASDSNNGDGDGDSAGDGDGDSAGDASSSDDKDDVCEEFCEQISACDGTEMEDCTDSCTDNTTTSREGQAVINECFSDDLCEEEVSEEAGIGALVCLLTESATIDPSEEAETYCDESVDIINECLETELDPDANIGTCESAVALASDELLAALNACAELDCEDVEGCVNLEMLKALPLDAIGALEEGETPSPAVLAELLTFGLVFSQLGLTDDTEVDIPTLPPMGGASGM